MGISGFETAFIERGIDAMTYTEEPANHSAEKTTGCSTFSGDGVLA